MFDVAKEDVAGEQITSLGPYRPYKHHKQCCEGSYPAYSGRLLDVKQSQPAAIKYFFDFIHPRLKKVDAIAVVPSHDPANGAGGLHTLAAKLAHKLGLVDASPALVRHTKIVKLADGGDRSIQVHLDSIHVPDAKLVHGRRVVLIDDIKTTGNSLIASRQLLLAAGAAEVKMLALGRTTYD